MIIPLEGIKGTGMALSSVALVLRMVETGIPVSTDSLASCFGTRYQYFDKEEFLRLIKEEERTEEEK